jgi:hypothetical protein
MRDRLDSLQTFALGFLMQKEGMEHKELMK